MSIILRENLSKKYNNIFIKYFWTNKKRKKRKKHELDKWALRNVRNV